MDATQHTRNATMMGACMVSGRASVPQSTRSVTLPAMAMVAPTLMSCPPEAAVTSVMPMARMASSEALSRMVMRLPESTGSPALFVSSLMAKNEGLAMRLTTTKTSSAAMGMKICRRNSARSLPCSRGLSLSDVMMRFHLQRWWP